MIDEITIENRLAELDEKLKIRAPGIDNMLVRIRLAIDEDPALLEQMPVEHYRQIAAACKVAAEQPVGDAARKSFVDELEL